MIDLSVSGQPVDMPKSITVDTFTYRVTDLPTQDGDSSGDYCRHAMEIRLRKTVAPGYLKKTFTHELFHLLWDCAGLRDDPAIDNDTEERIVEALSARLLPVMRENPQMVAWLCEYVGRQS